MKVKDKARWAVDYSKEHLCQRIEELEAENEELMEVCLNAGGAYRALEMIGVHKELPGYDHCLEKLEQVLPVP